jgi:hypothetical protein
MARLQRAFFTPGAADPRAAGAARPLKAAFFGLIFWIFFDFFLTFFCFFTPAPVGDGRGLFKFLYF